MSQPTTLEEDATFERLLLSAGRADALPNEEAQAALVRFTAGLSSVQAGLSAVGVVGAATITRQGAWRRFLAAAKWVALGVLAGTLSTWAWLRPPPSQLRIAPAVTAVAGQRVEPPASTAQALPQPVASQAMIPTKLEPRRVPHVHPSAPRSAQSGPGLAAEVSALDGVRTALAIGALPDAERQLTEYQRAFAGGALRNDAEVLTVELLVAQGRKQAAKRAAERFISQHPRDPQLQRVRGLIE